MSRPTSEQLPFQEFDIEGQAISPFIELGAYEALWQKAGMSFKRLAEMHKDNEKAFPSSFVDHREARDIAKKVRDMLAHVGSFGIRVHGMIDYPDQLRDAAHPVELIYFQGRWDYVTTRMVAVVGTRNPTRRGVGLASDVVKRLITKDFTVVSGLAKGIDTVVHQTAIDHGGRTIGVLGTPLSSVYPRENGTLQRKMAKTHLIISQVPVWRYSQQKPNVNKFFFPQRNITMSALTEATIIVEAGETSGTLVQARAALQQKRKLFILDHCFKNPLLSWPSRFAKMGAIRVSGSDDILHHMHESEEEIPH
ncbi:MAG: DNA-protecting protein DprA [Nitrospira sp.]|nr:DNA-protecting protein DprA [Nitrospira sp.]